MILFRDLIDFFVYNRNSERIVEYKVFWFFVIMNILRGGIKNIIELRNNGLEKRNLNIRFNFSSVCIVWYLLNI